MIQLAVAAPARARCGITDYARRLSAELPAHFEVSRIDLPDPVSACGSRSHWRKLAAHGDGADLVHVHYEYSLFGVVKPYRNRLRAFQSRLRSPVVVSLHDLLPSLTPRWSNRRPYRAQDLLRDVAYLAHFRGWERANYALARHWMVHNREHERVVLAMAGPDRVTRLVHPIPATSVGWHEPDQTGGSVEIVSPGFIKPHKGYSRFLGALTQLPGLNWTLVGGPQDDRDRDYARRLTEELAAQDLTNRVRITGYLAQTRVEQLAVQAKLAVFPFERVTGSGSVAWAIALGLPIVATDLPAMRELVDEGAGMELLPTAAPESWPELMARLLASPQSLKRLATANRAFARKHSYAQAGRRAGALFEQVLNDDGKMRV